jgi:hypothetical protein
LKVKIEDTEYTIIPIPPSLSPYSTHISEMLKVKPQSVADAEKMSVEIEKAMEKLLAGTVKPIPAKEHHIQVFNALVDLTNKVLEDARFFRQDKGSSPEKGSATSPGDSQEVQRDSLP